MTDETLITSREHTAGRAENAYDLDATRVVAQARANAKPRGPVGIYRHCGGHHPKLGRVQPTGEYLWRDIADDDDHEYPPPRFVWELVAIVQPS